IKGFTLLICILILNFILTLYSMFLISKDAEKRNIKSSYWVLLTFFFGFITIIFYIALNKNKTARKKIIDTRPIASNKEVTTINNKKNNKMPKFLGFYVIIQILLLYIFSIFTVKTVKNIYYLYVTYEIYEDNAVVSETVGIQGIVNNIDMKKYEKDIYDKVFSNIKKNEISNINENQEITILGEDSFNSTPTDIEEDIENYAKKVFSLSAKTIEANAKEATVINYFYPEPYTISSEPTGDAIVNNFANSLITCKFEYSEKDQGILSVNQVRLNFDKDDIASLKEKALKNFKSEDLKSVVIISQNVNGLTFHKAVSVDINTSGLVDFKKYNLKKGYPVYISIYSNILSLKDNSNL
ncbi:MAG: hypothetical protein K2L15_02025, partial [Eubacteriales bacterium]|nr:hypothetical protein [Eubacteriales bacterium]